MGWRPFGDLVGSQSYQIKGSAILIDEELINLFLRILVASFVGYGVYLSGTAAANAFEVLV